jgi:hypothetical protein
MAAFVLYFQSFRHDITFLAGTASGRALMHNQRAKLARIEDLPPGSGGGIAWLPLVPQSGVDGLRATITIEV